MKKSICFLLCGICVIAAYGGSYMFFAWNTGQKNALKTHSVVTPASLGNINDIRPETELVVYIKDLKTGSESVETSMMPAEYIGLDREALLVRLNEYMIELPLKEREAGLVSYVLQSFSDQKVILEKLYYPSDLFMKYYMIYEHGRIVVYYSDHKTVLEYPGIDYQILPNALKIKLLSGMEIKDEAELYSILQNYSS